VLSGDDEQIEARKFSFCLAPEERTSDSMTMLKRRYPVIAAVQIVLAAGLMWFLIHAGKLNTTAVAGASRHWPILLLGVVLLYLQVAIGAWRWNLLLGVQGLRLPLNKAFSLTMIGALFNIAIPGAVGGDVVKGYYLSRCTFERKTHAVTTVIVDRIVGLLGLLALTMFPMGQPSITRRSWRRGRSAGLVADEEQPHLYSSFRLYYRVLPCRLPRTLDLFCCDQGVGCCGGAVGEPAPGLRDHHPSDREPA
jgi:hypothetical protein